MFISAPVLLFTSIFIWQIYNVIYLKNNVANRSVTSHSNTITTKVAVTNQL